MRCQLAIGTDRTRLEMLNLSQNRLSGLVGLSFMPALIALNLGKSLPRLRHRF